MQNQNNNGKGDKRRGNDRRAQAIGLDFPFIDSHGNLVTEERRISDRRRPQSFNTNSKDVNQHKTYA